MATALNNRYLVMCALEFKKMAATSSSKAQQNWLLVAVQNCCISEKRIAKQALLQIQNFIRSVPGTETVRQLRECGGLPRLMSVLKSSNSIELLDVALSIVATCCRENGTRKAVQQLKGIPILLHILKAQSVPSVINRASRAIANLAEDADICSLLHRSKAVPLLVKLVNDQEDRNCRQSLVRALRILADDDRHKWEVTKEEGVKALLPCIQSEDTALVTCGIRALATITAYQQLDKADTLNKFLPEAARQIVSDPENTKVLLQLLSHSKTAIKEQALVVLVNLIPVDIFRVAIGNADGIKIFIEESCNQSSVTFPTYLHCLCCCCREAVNRAKVKELEGLSILLNVLKSNDNVCRPLHENVLSALLNFYYDEMSLRYLAAFGFIQLLVEQLLLSISVKSDGQTDNQKGQDKDNGGQDKDGQNKKDKMTKDKQCNITDKLVKGPRKQECNMTVNKQDLTAKCDEKGEGEGRKKSPPRPIPTRDPLPSDGGYGSDMSPESSSSAAGVMWSSAPSTSCSPPHMDWNAFMSHRPRLVAPDVSPMSSTSPRSTSPPKFSPHWSPHWSPQWSLQWSPSDSPAWEPMWSPQSSPERMVEDVFEAVAEEPCDEDVEVGRSDLHVEQPEKKPDETVSTGEGAEGGVDGLPDESQECLQEPTVDRMNVENETEQPSCSSDLLRGHVQSSSNNNQIDAKFDKTEDDTAVPIKCDQIDEDTATDTIADQPPSVIITHSTSEASAPEDPFRTPNYSHIKSRSGKRKAKLKNTPMKTAKCLDFTPADLPLDSAMSASPSHSSTRSSLGDQQEAAPEHKGCEHDALLLLSRYSHMDKPNQHLLHSKVITGLLDYWLQSPKPHPRCWRVLVRLLENRHCFEKLLLHRAPMIIYEKLYSCQRKLSVFRKLSAGGSELRRSEDEEAGGFRSKLSESDVEMENRNSLLYRLSSMAASKFGEGIMEHLLLVDDAKTQVCCVLAMPYLCRNPAYLKKMLIKHKGLDILLGYLRDDESHNSQGSLYSSAVSCLHDIANMKDLYKPLWDVYRERSIELLEQAGTDLESHLSTSKKQCAFTKYSSEADDKTSHVTFSLDDGTTITADRELVIQKSKYFQGLLEGHYAEANKTTVPLRHISNSALMCIIHHLHGCTPISCRQSRDLLESSYDVATETIATTGQYLLPRLQDMVSDIIVTKHMSPSSVAELYGHGQFHACQRLCKMSMLYLLCCHDVGRETFQEIAHRYYVEDIFEEFRNAILNSLQHG